MISTTSLTAATKTSIWPSLTTSGGAAFSKHLSVERHFRDARAAAVMAPTTDVLYEFIGKSLLDMPLF